MALGCGAAELRVPSAAQASQPHWGTVPTAFVGFYGAGPPPPVTAPVTYELCVDAEPAA